MDAIKSIFLPRPVVFLYLGFLVLLCFSRLHAQIQAPTGYTLNKTAVSIQGTNPETATFQWIAKNNSSAVGNFFILDSAPLQSVVQAGGSALPLSLIPNSSLLTPNSAVKAVVGPFAVAPGASVTLNVKETVPAGLAPHGETFALLSQSQLSSSNQNSKFKALALGATDDFVNRGLIGSAAAVPNISRNNQPVNFALHLNAPAQINLALFALTGEKVFSVQAQGSTGANTVVWGLQNAAGQSVASGLYLYELQVTGNGQVETRMGKVLIIH